MGKTKDKRRKTRAETPMKADEPATPLLETHLGYWLRQAAGQATAEFARALQARQVSVAEWSALSRIHDHPNITPSELADILGMTRGAVSKILDKLDAKGWISRRTTPGDQRVQQLSHTPDGGDILPSLAAVADQSEAFFSCLSDKEKTQLRAILPKLAAAYKKSGPKID